MHSWAAAANICLGHVASPHEARMDQLGMHQSQGKESRIHTYSCMKHQGTWDCSGSGALVQVRFPSHAAPAPRESCPLLRHECSLFLAWVSLHSHKEHLLFAPFSQLLYAQLCKSRTTSFCQIIYVEFAVSCSIHGDLPSTCFEIKLIKLEQN